MRPICQSRVPSWNLTLVLGALTVTPLEPFESVSEKMLTLKVALLLALTSLKRQETSRPFRSLLLRGLGNVRVILHPRSDYIPKVPSVAPQPVTFQAFFPSPHETLDQESLRLLCPVRALRIYVYRSGQWRRSSQLLVRLVVAKEVTWSPSSI